MKAYRTRNQLKTEVKTLLKGNWSKAIILFLIPTLEFWFTNVYKVIKDNFSVKYNNLTVTLDQILKASTSYGLVSAILGLIFILITLSATFRGLDWLEDPNLEFSPLKSNFTYFRSPAWSELIMLDVISYVFLLFWTILLIVPGVIKALAYSQTYFIYKDLNDHGLSKDHRLTDYITKSRQLMVGNKWRYFVLQLSFLGWWVLGLITLGIGFIWIYPYYKLTMANFYKDLKENNGAILA